MLNPPYAYRRQNQCRVWTEKLRSSPARPPGQKAALGAVFAKALAAEGAKVVVADAEGLQLQSPPRSPPPAERPTPSSPMSAMPNRSRRMIAETEKTIRPARYSGQQRRHRLEHSAGRHRGHRCRPVGRVHGGECARHVPLHQGRHSRHAPQQLRQDHQSGLDDDALGPVASSALRHQQGRHRCDDAIDGARAWRLRHPGEFAGAGTGDERFRRRRRWPAGRGCTTSC